jgi:hypothetical protein
MAVTSTDIVNQALQLIGNNQGLVTGVAPNFDNSALGIAAAKLYAPCVQTVARQFGWDFARKTVVLALSGNPSPSPAWAFEYLYPTNGVQVWQLMPAVLADPNNPLPVNWDVANDQVAGVQTKVILSNLAGALAVYNNNPTEATWDPLFREAVVRLLASEFAVAGVGRPDTAAGLLQAGAAFETLGESRLN